MRSFILIFYLFFALIFSNYTSFSQDTVIVQTETTIQFPDSLSVDIINTPQQSWLEENEGTIIGSFLAALIAVLSIFFTNRHNRKLWKAEVERINGDRINTYCGLLYATKSELIYLQKGIPYLIQELDQIKERSIREGKIIIDKPSRDLDVEFLKNIRIKFLEFEIYNTTIFVLVSGFINKCEFINNDIQLERLINLSQKLKEVPNFNESTNQYFKIVNNELGKISDVVLKIVDVINDDLRAYGKSIEHSESEYLKSNNSNEQS